MKKGGGLHLFEGTKGSTYSFVEVLIQGGSSYPLSGRSFVAAEVASSKESCIKLEI